MVQSSLTGCYIVYGLTSCELICLSLFHEADKFFLADLNHLID